MVNHSKRKPNTRNGGARKPTSGSVRIVAGQWRGRKIPVLDADGLRPTGDRVRETLFNWLQLDIPGRRCLDLFAGSGALGIEAASRGASSVDLVEAAKPVSEQLKQTVQDLNAFESVSVFQGSADEFLDSTTAQFDVVFVDPPFQQHLHEHTLKRLVQRHLCVDALVYVEYPTNERDLVNALPDELVVVKEKIFGDISVFLLQYRIAPP